MNLTPTVTPTTEPTSVAVKPSPACTFNVQWDTPTIVKLWTEGPDGVVRNLETAYGLGYRVFMYRFPGWTKREQAKWDMTGLGVLWQLRAAIEQWAESRGDVELIAYFPPHVSTDCVNSIGMYSEWTPAWDMLPDQNSASGLLIQAIGKERANGKPPMFIEPWWGGAEHAAFYGCRCVCTATEYGNRTLTGKRPDTGPLPDVYVIPDEKWPHIGSRYGLIEFCEMVRLSARAGSARIPMLPLDVVVSQAFDARPFIKNVAVGGGT